MKKDNFSKAMNEMFGVGGDGRAEAPAAEPVMAAPSEPYMSDEMFAPAESAAPESGFAAPPAPEPIVPEISAPDPFATAVPYTTEPSYNRAMPSAPVQKTILAAGTTFVGNMTAQGDVDMDCEFQGDIRANGTVTIRTKLAGDLSARVAELVSCEVQGDVHADESVRIDSNSKVIGNITGKDLNCSGSIQGNVQVSGHVQVSGSAYIEGDLEAASISIENGAGISGQMQVLPRRVQ
ncbi:polymer-forming cytoskeletal protein [uncultured Oscillibacter sp.]|uniref:bactofilin family protein n=1 Tax=uncultured Oscillibacter sp. TaxID=876091 RepID=UPI0025F0E9A2|nr:polymer-forming cytoskeletal protein [uncultured Oscillibacter sp.]